MCGCLRVGRPRNVQSKPRPPRTKPHGPIVHFQTKTRPQLPYRMPCTFHPSAHHAIKCARISLARAGTFPRGLQNQSKTNHASPTRRRPWMLRQDKPLRLKGQARAASQGTLQRSTRCSHLLRSPGVAAFGSWVPARAALWLLLVVELLVVLQADGGSTRVSNAREEHT